MAYIYSPEPLDTLLTTETITNTSGSETPVIGRSCKNSKIYIKYVSDGDVYSQINRFYFDDGFKNILNDGLMIPASDDGYFVYPHVATSNQTPYEENFIAYQLNFIGLYLEETSFVISEIGIVFDDIIGTKDHQFKFSSSMNTDINNVPTSNQIYDIANGFTLITNRTNIEEIDHVLEKPFYLVDINGCLDNSSNLLSNNGISFSYPTSNTKIMEINFKNIGDI